MSHNFENIEDTADLERRLRDLTSFSDSQIYEFGLVLSLLGACLNNLRENAVAGELEDIPNRLDLEQKEFLVKLTALPSENELNHSTSFGELTQIGAE